ncbi:MAG: SWIM zinc finger family protein [Anaerolineales bacterium]|nr:SWIM zinc finger family protein [Anaerolineales bacterium]
MTAKEIAKRNQKAEQLKVLQTDDGQFFVESGEGKILYNVLLDDEGNTCTCGDFAKNIKKDKNFRCKHILSVMNAIPTGEVENGIFLEKLIPKLDDRFLTNIKGKDFVLYAGVLDLATQKGLLKLEVELIQFPNKENGHEAVCHAVAVGKNGEVFADIGDANPGNCHSMIAKHLIRMASTRAKARALRDMCNVGITALEEISDFDDIIGSDQPKKATQKKAIGKTDKKEPKAKVETKKKPPTKDDQEPKAKAKQPKAVEKVEPNGESDNQGKSDQPKMSEAQKRAVFNLSRRRGISVEELETMAMDAYNCALENLTTTDASTFIRQLQQAA